MKVIKLLFLFVLAIVITASALAVSVGASSAILGDADGDGEVCITDATMIQRDVAQVNKIGDRSRQFADVDSDSMITIMDATSVQRWLAHFSVTYPIGEPILIPTEESNPAVITEPTVIRNHKTVTVDGTAFNISKIPDAVTLDDSSGNCASFMLRNKALPEPADVHIEVVSKEVVRRIDYSDERYKETYLAELNGKALGCDYLIRDEHGNDIAWVNAHFTNGVYPYQVSITGLSGGTASFSVDFYYRDTLLKSTSITVNLSKGYGYADGTKATAREIESKSGYDRQREDKSLCHVHQNTLQILSDEMC